MAREPYNMTQEQIDNIAQRLHSYEADDYTLKWGKQTSKYRNSMRKSVRNMLSALEQDGFKLAGRSPAPAAGIEDPLKKAVAAFNALSPEQQAEMLEDQRQSWVRGNIGLIRDERGMTSPVMPQPTTAMASELKPWRYEIKYGPEGEANYAWVYDDRGEMVATMKTHKAKQIVDAMNTRPAPAATDTGLVTVVWQDFVPSTGWVASSPSSIAKDKRELVTRSQAEAVIAELQAKAKDYREYSERLVKRLESEEATRSQAEELLAAKDADTDRVLADNRRCLVRIAELEADNAALIHDLNRIKDHETELVNDNAAKDARIKELEVALDSDPDGPGLWRFWSKKSIELSQQLRDKTNTIKAIEAKLAAAEKALEPLADIADLIDAETEGMAETDELVLHFHDYEFAKWPVSLFRKARAVLGGKPS